MKRGGCAAAAAAAAKGTLEGSTEANAALRGGVLQSLVLLCVAVVCCCVRLNTLDIHAIHPQHVTLHVHWHT